MADTKRIDTNDPLIWYRESVRYALDTGSAPGIRGQRDALSGARLSESQLLKLYALDEEAIIDVLDMPEIDTDLMQDDDTQPLFKWWWHLGKIRNKTYPVELLPVHLKAIYTETDSDKKAA